jgi:hypothetical protein
MKILEKNKKKGKRRKWYYRPESDYSLT